MMTDSSISNSYLNKTADVFIFQEQVSRKTTPAFRQLNNPSNINEKLKSTCKFNRTVYKDVSVRNTLEIQKEISFKPEPF